MQENTNEIKDTKPNITGCRFLISNEVFLDFLCEKFGFQREKLHLHDITTNHFHRAVSISLWGTDPSMPLLKEGEEYPFVKPVLKVENGRVFCDGFMDINSNV